MAAQAGVPTFKVILVGEAGVGKTSFFCRARDDRYVLHETLPSTIGTDCCKRPVAALDKTVNVNLWDTAGVERFRTLTRNYYRNTQAALLVFSMNDSSSLYQLTSWIHDVRETAPTTLAFLVGSKADLERKVTSESIQSFASAHDCQAAFLTSAKTGEGIEEALTAISEHLLKKHHHHTNNTAKERLWQEGSGLHVHGATENVDKSRCCW